MMNRYLSLLALILTAGFAGCTQRPDKTQTVNPILGDASYISSFGAGPDGKTSEELRVGTHLRYVEELLRGKDMRGLSTGLRAKRLKMLDLLHKYRVAGIFPRNYEHPEKRVPCFIDREGRICAVGYLIEQTAGREAAEAINIKHKYEELLAMNDRAVDHWIEGSGLTKEEAAMIQPTYGYTPPMSHNYIKQDYGAASAVLTGINLSMIAINGIQMSNQSGSRVLPMIGLISGVGQVILGAGSFPDDESNQSQNVLCMVNVGLGTAGIVLSGWNLMSSRPPKDRRTSWNIYSFPTIGGDAGLALSVTRRF
jgi:hypothetical protein